MSWTPIPEDPDFDKLVGYRMYYYDQTHVRNTTIAVNQTQVNITDVKQNVDYIIRVVGLTVGKREGRDASTSAIIKNITGKTKLIVFNIVMVLYYYWRKPEYLQ